MIKCHSLKITDFITEALISRVDITEMSEQINVAPQ